MNCEPRNTGTALAAALLMALPALAAVPARPASAAEPEPAKAAKDTAAAWLARANEALLPGPTLTAKMRIATRDGFGGEQTLVLELARQVEADGSSRSRLEVEEPEEAQGTLFQVSTGPEGRALRHVWSPASTLVRTVSGVRGTAPFLGTEFNYEDLALIAPQERMQGEVRRVEEDGRPLVEVRSAPYHAYEQVVTLIDPQTALPVRVTFVDRAGQPFREERFEDVRSVDGHPIPHRITIRDALTEAGSVLTLSDVVIGAPLPTGFDAPSPVDQRIAGSADARSRPGGGGAAGEGARGGGS